MKLPWRRRSASSGNLLSGFQIGLRGRITLAVALVGLLLSVVLSVTTITVARSTLLDTREDSLSRQALANSETVGSGADVDNAEATDLQTLLSSLPQGGIPSLIVGGNGEGEPVTVSVNPKYGVDVLPSELRTRVVEDRENSIMRFHSNGQPLLAVGVAVPDSDASYFEVNTLDDIDTAIRSLSLTLLVATALATIVAMALGFWASRYARCTRCVASVRPPSPWRSASSTPASTTTTTPATSTWHRSSPTSTRWSPLCRSASTATPGSRAT